ncbi:uncharacterized protein LOC129956901 [Argiope bruennichi]|uniref:uncharacterized protein LOC129956901 n=1 Tax=Argiope bruennichi TaxID=94029 RepID=UPI00249409F7|nr:uncharacterized protein LOC129956901 [Argiope bruennichi]
MIYRMTRVLFGVSSSPFLLAATIKYHLKRYVDNFPDTCAILNNSLYVDDLISGRQNVEDALKTSLESFKIFKDASMILRKWQTNSFELRDRWKDIGMDIGPSIEPKNETFMPSKVLGVVWNPDRDLFHFDAKGLIQFLSKRMNTKRFLLQAAGRIFDPVGFLGPFIIRLKILIQELWCLGLDWDERFPMKLDTDWNEWCEEVLELNAFNIPRYYFGDTHSTEIDNIQMHCFSDASKKAYGAVVYFRVALKDGKSFTSFVASKCRVAPLKTISIPRLELMSALLAARLSNKISKAIKYPLTHYFWTDSSITYFWIKGAPSRFKPFVKNRIQEIQRFTDPKDWRHCPGKDNPADLISRGMSAAELRDSDFWWHGPDWLAQNEHSWPKSLELSKQLNIENIENYELCKGAILTSTVVECPSENDLIIKYSSFDKLVRITAWCLRFINNCKINISNRKEDYLSAIEIQNATKMLVKYVQRSEFKSEIKYLQLKHPIPKNSKILSLNPFLDKDELLRVGGRLKFSNLSDNQKHQLLLPKSHHFTDLIIEHFHKISLHSGTQTTLFLIRQSYWIPSGQDRVRRVINRCLTCFKARSQTINQMMGDLPRDRVIPSRPFEKVGLDFAGPIITKPNLKRSRVTLKSYIAIFICFSTRATHFEVVFDLTTESFLACLRRFIARRSKPSIIWSDNATNFKGAKNILDSLLKACKSDTVQRFCSKEGIVWNFIPPASPHFGGLWEANIGAMKRILLKVTKSTVLTFEELTTLVTQIEAVLNSRPLCPLSADPADLQPLTPGHFLVGAPLLSIPEPSDSLTNISLSSRWSLIQSLRSKFWKRWSQEYLNSLQSRAKWKLPQLNIKPGQLVLLKDNSKSPMEWNLARIEKTYPGTDGLVRVADIRTPKGIFRRSINRLCPLPFEESVGQLSNGGRNVPS